MDELEYEQSRRTHLGASMNDNRVEYLIKKANRSVERPTFTDNLFNDDITLNQHKTEEELFQQVMESR